MPGKRQADPLSATGDKNGSAHQKPRLNH